MPSTSESNSERLTDPRVGSLIGGRYRIEGLLDEGAMGQVYRAEHIHMRKRVAVKILRRELTRVPEVLARFEREAMAAANISHQHVAAATDFGKLNDDSVYLVLEYVEGRTLRSELGRGGLSVRRALHIGRQIADALSAAHELEIVHRDLKPENVMLVERGADADYVKVLDFGVAKVPVDIAESAPSKGGFDSLITKAGMIFGTPDYMSPEQALGQSVDYRADLYSLGVVLYEMLTGARPFRTDHELGVLGQQLSTGVPAMARRAPGVSVPQEVEAFVRSLMVNEASGRLGSAAAARSEMSRLIETAPDSPPPATRGPQQAAVSLSSDSESDIETPLHAPLIASGFQAPGASPVLGGARRWTSGFAAGVVNGWRHANALKSRLPEPLNLFPLWVLVGVPLFFVCGATALVLALSGEQGFITDSSLLPPSQVRPFGPAEIPDDAASVKPHPNDTGRRLARARALVQDGQFAAAAREIEGLLKQDPTTANDEFVAGVLWKTAQVDESSQLTSRLLLGPMGAKGADISYDLAVSPDVSAAVAKSARAWLKTRSFEKNSTKEASVAAALLLAPSCRVRAALVKRAQNAGDQRALVLLRRFAAGQGCGAGEPKPCNACLKEGKELKEAIAALAAAAPK